MSDPSAMDTCVPRYGRCPKLSWMHVPEADTLESVREAAISCEIRLFGMVRYVRLPAEFSTM